MTVPAVRTGSPLVREDENTNGGAAEPVPIGSLLHLAIEKGITPDAMEKLVVLHERIEDRNAAKAFIGDLAAFKAECPPIVHSREANFSTRGGGKVKYSYTELDELALVIDPVLNKHGFSYGWDERLDKGLVTTICTLYHVSGHTRQSSFTLPADNDSAASPQQKIGIADTYAKRRSLISVLGLTTAEKDPRTKEIDPSPIDEAQLQALEELLDDAEIDVPRFLKFLRVEKLADLPRVRFDEAKAAIAEKKRRKGAQ